MDTTVEVSVRHPDCSSTAMYALIVSAIIFICIPLGTFHAVGRLTGSELASWIAAILSIPLSIVIYARFFYYLKRKLRLGEGM